METCPSSPAPKTCAGCSGRRCPALAQEQLRVLLLNTKNQVMGQRVIYQGNVSSAIVRTAEVFRPAVIEAVPGIIISHNHPSPAIPTPSPEDADLTRELVQAGKLLDIELLDHVVIGGERFVSLKGTGPHVLTAQAVRLSRGGNASPRIHDTHGKETSHARNPHHRPRRPLHHHAPGDSRPPPTPSPATRRPTASGSSRWSAPRRRSRRSGPPCSSSPPTPPTSSVARTAWRLSGGYQRCVDSLRDGGDVDDQDRPPAGLRRLARPGLHQDRRVRIREGQLPAAGADGGGGPGAPSPLPRQAQPAAPARLLADWLWRRGLDEGEIVPLQSVGVSAYRCSPKAAKLREDLSGAVASGWLTLPREEGETNG